VKNNVRLSLAVVALLSFFALPAMGAVILSNLGNSDGNGNNDQIINGGNVSTRIRAAVGFTIGATEQSGQFLFTIRANNPNLRLVNDAFGSPEGSSLAFANPAPSTTVSGNALGYTLSYQGTLSANTVYWIVAAVESSTIAHSYTWVDRGTYTANGASFYQAQAEAFGGWNEIQGANLSLQIEVTPVPEPVHAGGIAAFLLGFCCLFPMLRQTRAAQRLRALLGARAS
jgi:hypothetical protein